MKSRFNPQPKPAKGSGKQKRSERKEKSVKAQAKIKTKFPKMQTSTATKRLVTHFRKSGIAKWHLRNQYFYEWESDILMCYPSNYVWEIEVKVSRADFLADKKKEEKHYCLKNATGEIPNYFSYACPEGLIKPEDLPKDGYAGLIYIRGGARPRVWEIVKKPTLHNRKIEYNERLFMKIVAMNDKKSLI